MKSTRTPDGQHLYEVTMTITDRESLFMMVCHCWTQLADKNQIYLAKFIENNISTTIETNVVIDVFKFNIQKMMQR